MSVIYGNLEIERLEIDTASSGGKLLMCDFKQTTTRVTEPETVKIYIGWKRADGSGDVNYNRYWNFTFSEKYVSPYVQSVRVVDAIFQCDYLFSGDTYRFWLKAVSADDERESKPVDITLPANFTLPAANYMIPQRPTQQTQEVYYNGAYRGEAGCCVSSALAAAKEVQEIRSGKGVIQNSIGWFFGATAENGDFTYYNTALNFLRDTGMMPYPYLSKPPYIAGYPDVYLYNDVSGCPGARSLYLNNINSERTRPQKIKSWSILTDGEDFFNWQGILDAIQRSSGSGSSVVVMTLGTEDAIYATSSNGIVGDCRGSGVAGHMMIVLGWRTISGRKYWVCQNSWGAGRGDDGLYYMPFSNTRCGHMGEAETGIQRFYEVIDDPNAPPLPAIPVAPWSWTSGNGSASAAQTRNAYAILNGTRAADDFSHLVWNDLVDKAMEMRAAKGYTWDRASNLYPSQSGCKVSAGETLSAKKYNGVRYNIGSVRATGIFDVSPGDGLTGYHIARLAEVLNEIINSL